MSLGKELPIASFPHGYLKHIRVSGNGEFASQAALNNTLGDLVGLRCFVSGFQFPKRESLFPDVGITPRSILKVQRITRCSPRVREVNYSEVDTRFPKVGKSFSKI